METELEDDWRWIAEIPQLPGVLAYGMTQDEASARAQILAHRVVAERLEHRRCRVGAKHVIRRLS
ncbi:MAG TPA: type II toxin-antitoxin system HicB family antitoxin [Hyphomicrobiaceae bacterium]|nr:type II toxin-antitoxin system HicB family antitoxin [Hyphomicrobiaceae bacterium]